MSPEPIALKTREILMNVRNLLMEQHKLLLDSERAAYEKANGPVGGPGNMLQLLLNDPAFAWLRQISTLVVEIDEALAPRSKADQAMAEALVQQTRESMRPREHGTEFQLRYFHAIQDSPDAVILQCRLEQLVGS